MFNKVFVIETRVKAKQIEVVINYHKFLNIGLGEMIMTTTQTKTTTYSSG
jgi:hypothetical protein